MAPDSPPETAPSNFIHKLIDEDLASNKYDGRVHTRFPPEPNGYLHIGHAKSICLNFGLAERYQGHCNLRFDDTNPTKEEQEYVDSITKDVAWLGFEWHGEVLYASDYFDQLYEWAILLIKKGKAYVDSLSSDEIRQYRGTLTEPGRESPYRNRSVAENLALFEKMRAGDLADGEAVLRAKIDMASPNIKLRDPVMYRILHAHHHRTGDKWCIYPMYDWAHGQSDSIEGITHSICTLEFEDHRPLYEWFIRELEIYAPQQIEFARLNLSYTLMSKRKLLKLVEEGYVNGWDDPRMPTLSGLRRRGYTAAAIRNFAERIGVSKNDTSVVDVALLEYCIREDLNQHARRVMAVQDPLKLVITNYPKDQVEYMTAKNNQEDDSAGTRQVPFSGALYIEREDFMENASRKFYRMTVGKEVRLLHAYYVTCTGVEKDDDGHITTVFATYDPATRGGWSEDGRRVKGTLHWVSIPHAVPAEVRQYDRLFNTPNPEDAPEGADFTVNLNPDSLTVITAHVEPSLTAAQPGDCFQFIRKGYYAVDPDSTADKLVFNQTVTLRDSWTKIKGK